jgi:hypothetical protein
MPAITQLLGHDCSADAPLRRAARVNLYKPSTSVCSFVGQHREELRPAGIVNRLGQNASGETLYPKILHRNQTVGVHQLTRELVLKVCPLVADEEVRGRRAHYWTTMPFSRV